jgi:hypothetical protein
MDSDSLSGIVQVLGVLGIGTVGAAIVVAISSRKRTGAETNEKVVATTGELLDLANEEIARRVEESRQNRADRIVWESRQRRWWERADAHAQWDRDRIREAVEDGRTVPTPPPLFPAEGE